jgi:hypothetical protein
MKSLSYVFCIVAFLPVTKIHMNYTETVYKCKIYSYNPDSALKRCKPTFPILIWPWNPRALRSFAQHQIKFLNMKLRNSTTNQKE